MFISKKNREKFYNPDGSIKRFLKVVEVLPDGTRVFENGYRQKPSMVDFGDEGGLVRLDKMNEGEQAEWEKKLFERVGRAMSVYYRSKIAGGDN